MCVYIYRPIIIKVCTYLIDITRLSLNISKITRNQFGAMDSGMTLFGRYLKKDSIGLNIMLKTIIKWSHCVMQNIILSPENFLISS